MAERKLTVGIYSEPTVNFILNGEYILDSQVYTGEHTATYQDGKVLFESKVYDELVFEGVRGDGSVAPSFTLIGVTIGVNFHWQRREDQTFLGDLKIIAGYDKVLNSKAGLIAINVIDVEDYLVSVISSEMSATSSFELLKAHAVTSRSWLLHPILNPHIHEPQQVPNDESDERIVWYERDAHTLFDVCADDHCQRYQGITKQTSDNVQKAIDETRGLVIVSNDNGEVCDARFYKACGGVTEVFENCWADEHFSYLEPVLDYRQDTQAPAQTPPDLTNEEQAERWIRTSPDAFCNTNDRRILQQVLNDYDQETTDFYRWQVEYKQDELSELVKTRSGIDFGTITDLLPIKRGPSARLYQLKVVGTKRTMVIGKELEIRKWLSPSHLYSSAFVVDKLMVDGDVIFRLTGAGWGHGVGLCQIGAAVMADKGFTYKQILEHYFPNTMLRGL